MIKRTHTFALFLLIGCAPPDAWGDIEVDNGIATFSGHGIAGVVASGISPVVQWEDGALSPGYVLDVFPEDDDVETIVGSAGTDIAVIHFLAPSGAVIEACCNHYSFAIAAYEDGEGFRLRD